MDRKVQQQFGFNWGKYLTDKKSFAAPVHLFDHAQMASNWNEIDCGVKVEVLNTDCPVSSKVYWIAEIIKVAGYKALLRYEGYGDDNQNDFWCNLCTHDVHAVGWCATVGKPLVPPRDIQFKYSNWKNFLIQRLTGSKTLPNDFNNRITKSLECQFKTNMRLEVMDKTQISRKRIGIVEEVVGGRLRLQYEDSDEAIDDFWCHSNSYLIHPVGWSERIGHRILVANKDYKTVPGFPNARPDMFASVKPIKNCGFKVGMKLEAIDPLNLSSICVATVQKVLKDGYLMIGIDGSMATGGSDWFCFHCTSPSIFPIGYCEANDITLCTPNHYKPVFRWSEYLQQTESEPAPVHCFLKERVDHEFVAGMKLEAVDLMEPRLLCVATVSRVVGRLLQIHFDGWDAEYDQWIDCRSPDIFPVGWCELVNYSLQAPANYKAAPFPGESERNKRKNKARNQGFSGKKKRKKLSSSEKKDLFEVEDAIDHINHVMTSESDMKEVVDLKEENFENGIVDIETDENSSFIQQSLEAEEDPSKDSQFPGESEEDYLNTSKNLGPPTVTDGILDDLDHSDENDMLLPSETSAEIPSSKLNSISASTVIGDTEKEPDDDCAVTSVENNVQCEKPEKVEISEATDPKNLLPKLIEIEKPVSDLAAKNTTSTKSEDSPGRIDDAITSIQTLSNKETSREVADTTLHVDSDKNLLLESGTSERETLPNQVNSNS